MKTFKSFSKKEKSNPVVLAFGRMNPPTKGHSALVKKVKEVSEHLEAPHEIILSKTQDKKKNPLAPNDKLKFAKEMFPGSNIRLATKEMPTIMHHAERLHKAGHDELHIVAGDDRVEELNTLFNHYNGKPDRNGKVAFNFSKIEVHSAGKRDAKAAGTKGASATKLREYAAADDYDSFKEGLPKIICEDTALDLFSAVKRGMTTSAKRA